MSAPRVRPLPALVVLALVGATSLVLGGTTACNPGETPCTAESSGFGDKPSVTRRMLEGLDPKEGTCRPRVVALHSREELRRAYDESGLGELDLPEVDWTRESVVLREATHGPGVRWLVADGPTMTLGLQGCREQATDVCHVEVFAVEAQITSVNTHVCPEIGCAGAASVTPIE